MGNGPSLNTTNWGLLKDQIVVGLNKIFLLFERVPIRPNYVVCHVPNVVEQNLLEFESLEMPLFLSEASRCLFRKSEKKDIYYFGPPKRYLFAENPNIEICVGGTVTYVALQLLYYMGFEKVVLIGVDFNFQYDGPADQWFQMKSTDPNHFDSNYFAKGEKWQAPNLERQLAHFEMASCAYQEAGRIIVDATSDGRLQVFPKMDLKSALSYMPNNPHTQTLSQRYKSLYEADSGPEDWVDNRKMVDIENLLDSPSNILIVFADRNYSAVDEIQSKFPWCRLDVWMQAHMQPDWEKNKGKYRGELIPYSGMLHPDMLDSEWGNRHKFQNWDAIIYTRKSDMDMSNVESFCKFIVDFSQIPIIGYTGNGKGIISRT